MKKNPKADLENFRTIFLLLGLIVSLAAVYFLLGYSVKNVKVEDLSGQNQAVVEEEQVMVTQRKIELPPPPPPKPQISDIIEVVDDNTEIKNEFNFDVDVDEDEATDFVETDFGNEEEEEDTKIYQLSEISVLPEFPGGEAALTKYIAEHIHYPEEAIENEIEGTVYVRFVVLKNGRVGKVEILRSVDPLLDEEAIRVVKTLPPFKPGMQGGHPVNVWFILPITFRLAN